MTAYAAAAAGASAEVKHWHVELPMGDGLFPSYIVATASMKEPEAEQPPRHLGDWREMVGVAFQPVHEDTKLRIEVSGTRFVRPSSSETALVVPGFVYHIFPPLAFDYTALRAVRDPTPETVTIKVSDVSYGSEDQVRTTTETQTLTVHAVTDCPIALNREAWSWMLAAYVNENSPVIEGIMQEALRAGIVTHFAGYQVGGDDVRQQVFAVWFVLQQRGIKYSDITTPSSNSDQLVCQTVRTLDESVKYQQAACVDGSVLFASVFRKIGLRTALVTVPRHCFVVVYLHKTGTQMMSIETTALGEGEPAGERAGDHPPSAYTRARSMESFVRAIKYWFDPAQLTEGNEGAHLIDVDRWRKQGLNPI